MSIGRWIVKEVVVHIHNGILLRYKKERMWVSFNEADETGAYYTEWSKSESKTQILYIDQNKLWKILKRWEYQTTWPASWETYMQVRKQQLELDMEQQTGSK